MNAPQIHERFTLALDGLVARVSQDRSIIAAILCGSLSHDVVWEKSDIDLVLVTIDEKPPRDDLALYADGLNIHSLLVPRSEFRKAVDGSSATSFLHSFLAKGRLIYTHDPSIAELCATLKDVGGRDQQLELLRAATAAVGPIYKAHKWFLTRRDLEYTALWILYAATPLARLEVVGHGLLADREVIPQAMLINPSFFKRVYSDLLNQTKTAAALEAALQAVDEYLWQGAPRFFAPVIEHLREVGEARSCTELENHFVRSFDVSGVTVACEYLADRGLIGKASTPVRLTRKSNVAVEELAFFYSANGPGS